MKQKKLLILIFSTILSVLSYCADEINVMIYDRGTSYSTKGDSDSNNKITRWIQQEMLKEGVKVNFIGLARNGVDEKINVLLAANQAPDIIMVYDKQKIIKPALQGGLLDLTPYMNKLDKDVQKDFADIMGYGKINGKQFAFVRKAEVYGLKYFSFIRKDLLDGVGLSTPKNRDELVKALYAIKKKYPEITPYGFHGMSMNDFMAPFILSYTSTKNKKNNFIYDGQWNNLKPGAKEGFKQLNKLYLDGLLSKDFFLDTNREKYLQDIANGKIALITGDLVEPLKSYETVNIKNYDLIGFNPFKNVDGEYTLPSDAKATSYIYVPKASEKRIQGIIKYINFMAKRKNSLNILYGIEGLGYNLNAKGEPIAKPAEELKSLGIIGAMDDRSIMIRTMKFSDDFMIKNLANTYPKTPPQLLTQYYKMRFNSKGYFLPMTDEALPTDQYVPLLQNLVRDFALKTIAAPEGKFEEVYKTEYSKLVENHLEDVFKARAKYYDEKVKK